MSGFVASNKLELSNYNGKLDVIINLILNLLISFLLKKINKQYYLYLLSKIIYDIIIT